MKCPEWLCRSQSAPPPKWANIFNILPRKNANHVKFQGSSELMGTLESQTLCRFDTPAHIPHYITIHEDRSHLNLK